MNQSGNKANPRRVTVVSPHRSLARYSALTRVDHEDTWCVRMDGWPNRPAEQCARIVLDKAPVATRVALRRGWANIGLKLDSGPNTILGWTIRRNTPELVVLALPSRVGMPAELTFRRDGQDLLFATLVRHRNPVVRLIWRAVLPFHMPIVGELLTGGCSRLAAADGPSLAGAGRGAMA